jgi:hypothetical protein
MKKFLSEYWAWIVVPFAIVLALLAALMFLIGSDDGASPFQYNVF